MSPSKVPTAVAEFLGGRRFAVAGVSRDSRQTANVIYRKLRNVGYEVVAINPNAAEVEGGRCYPNVSSLPEPIDGVLIATHPRVSLDIVRQCAECGVPRVWFHRSFGRGSVSSEAVRECQLHGIRSIVGGCPMMYCDPVDPTHRCMLWWLRLRKRVPA
jgi:predicted CoA-binding protein